MIKRLLFFFSAIVLSPAVGFSQADKVVNDSNYTFLTGRNDLPSTPVFRLEASGTLGLESQNFSTNSLLELTSTGFLNEAEKQTLLDEISNRFSLGFQQSWSVGIFNQARRKGILQKDVWGFSIYQKAYTAVGMPKSTFELALRGNKPFAGTTVDLSNTKYQNWLYTGLRYQFQFTAAKQRFEMASSIILGHSFVEYTLNDFTLYTEPDGSSVDVQGNYALREHQTDFDYGIGGMGTAIDLSTEFNLGKKSTLSLGISDFGIVYWTRGQTVINDTNFSFTGIGINNIFDVKDSLISSQIDDIESNFWFNSDGYHLSLMPFKLGSWYRYTLSERGFTSLNASVEYIYLPGYAPRLQVGTIYSTNPNHIFKATVGYGGFNGLTAGLGYGWQINKRLSLSAEVHNVFGVVTPTFGMGSLFSGSLKYYL